MSSPLKQNTTNLQNLLNKINSLPEASTGVELPELTDPAEASELFQNKQLIDANGEIVTGTFTIDDELTAQDELIVQILNELKNKTSNNIDVSGVTVTPSDVLEGKLYVDSTGALKVGTIPKQEAKTITPNTTNQTAVDTGKYTAGAITVVGDANLVAENIAEGVSIFGVTGTHSGGSSGLLIGNKLNGATIDLSHISPSSTVLFHQYTIYNDFDTITEVIFPTAYLTGSIKTNEKSVVKSGYNTISINGCGLRFNYSDGGTLTLITNSGSSNTPTLQPVVLIFTNTADDIIDCDCFHLIYHEYVCLLKDTLITLINGKTKYIQEITYDDELLVWDFDNGCYTSAKPLWLTKTDIAIEYWHCEFENGLTLDMVGPYAHRVFSLEDNKFIYAVDCIGKDVVTTRGITKLLSCELIKDMKEYYNIMTDYHINCYANDVLTSTGLNNIYPIQDMKFIKEERPIIPIEKYSGIPKEFYDGLRLAEWTEEDIDWVTKNLQKKLRKMKPKYDI